MTAHSGATTYRDYVCGHLGKVSTRASHSERSAFGSQTTFICCDFKKPELGLDIR
jgi:hypothetical protein